ncbi:hypothetical protein cgp_4003 [Corynebacterium glutamicum MB001]|nr:hypothetical protein cgp_4003 [Corynebacterium glutamicum MB001]ASW13146.1 hypothetical protein cgc1_4003 [Corynebacterium glutamicum]QYO72608.1 hypothetical protein cgisf_4003 [Corynebacterium glutamicum]
MLWVSVRIIRWLQSFNAAFKREVPRRIPRRLRTSWCAVGRYLKWCTRYNTSLRQSWCGHLTPAMYEIRGSAILKSAS